MRYISLLPVIQSSTSVLCSPLSDVKENHMRQTSWAMSQGDPLLVSLQH